MSWYKSGTIAATNGSKIITGTGTQFTNPLNSVSAGRMLLLPAAGTVQIYEIDSVQSDTQLTLVSAYTGTTGTGKAYAIPTSPAVSIEQFAHEFASTLAYYQQQLSGWQQILTGTGNITLTTPDGTQVTVRSQKAWDDALNGKVTGVKQASSTDAALNAIMALAANGEGSFGLGGLSVRMPPNSDVAAYLRTRPSGFYSILGDATSSNLPGRGQIGWLFYYSKFNNTPSGTVIATGTLLSARQTWYGVIDATTITWTRIWDTNNLTFPLSIGNGGSGKNTGSVANAPNPGSTQSTLTEFLSAVSSYGNNSIGSINISDDGGSWHTILSVRHRSGVADGGSYGYLLEDRDMTGAHYNAFVLRKHAAGNWLAPVTLWHSGNLANPATLDTAQTIGGAKTFSQDITLSKVTPRITFENTSNATGVVGRVVDVQYGANTLDFIRRSTAGQSVNQQAIRFTYPSSGTGIYAAVISGLNAVADSNGFWKTASPVVKLFADGTSELTSEAEGITTERVSEGVYRISGCLGLNADRAWGGDEGGIDVPMCRNKLPRLWVDYGGDEGSEKINPDGSIVIRTYHRPHPDAPAFARNEIEGYANGDPIDIPHDTFISVRVQMPEREEPKPKVMHSNVYCNT